MVARALPTPARSPLTGTSPAPAAPTLTEPPTTPAAPTLTEPATTPAAPTPTEPPTAPAAPTLTEPPTAPAAPTLTEPPTAPAAPTLTEPATAPAAPTLTEPPTAPAAPTLTEPPTAPAAPTLTEPPTAPAAPTPTEPPTAPAAPTPTEPATPTAGTASPPSPETPTPAPPPPTDTTTTPDPPSPGPDDGLPPRLPLVPGSVASTTRAWSPAAQDTCPQALHDRFSVVGPDGKRYPTWHPPTVTDPATGRPCTFGHEHGDDPRASDLYGLVADHLASPDYAAFKGLPFGLAAETLDAYSPTQSPVLPRRSEDHVGYKVNVLEDVPLAGPDGAALHVSCDYLAMVHQGSHSADALSNNVHELLYAVRCSDGTELVSWTLSRFGAAGSFTRSCDQQVLIATTDNGYPDGGGARSIPDRTCVERDYLVPPGRSTSPFALYEVWSSENALTLPDGSPLAAFDTSFGVFNPSRYASSTNTAGRSLALCFETLPDGRKASSVACRSAGDGTRTFDDEASPFDGTRRDVFVGGTTVAKPGQAVRWWTDPYGGHASTEPFPGAVCQLVGPSSSSTPGARPQSSSGARPTTRRASMHRIEIRASPDVRGAPLA